MEILDNNREEQLILFKEVFKDMCYQYWNNYDIFNDVEIFYQHIKTRYDKPVMNKPKSSFLILDEIINNISLYLVIGQSYHIGGESGGHYDEPSKPYNIPVSEQKRNMFFFLDEFLIKIAPELTLVEYKEMLSLNPLLEEEYYKSEHYGNSEYYSVKHLALEPLFQYLYHHDLLLTRAQLLHSEKNKLENNIEKKDIKTIKISCK